MQIELTGRCDPCLSSCWILGIEGHDGRLDVLLESLFCFGGADRSKPMQIELTGRCDPRLSSCWILGIEGHDGRIEVLLESLFCFVGGTD